MDILWNRKEGRKPCKHGQVTLKRNESRKFTDIDEMLLLHPSWNTVEGVYGLCESRCGKTSRRNESESGWKAAKLAQPGADISI